MIKVGDIINGFTLVEILNENKHYGKYKFQCKCGDIRTRTIGNIQQIKNGCCKKCVSKIVFNDLSGQKFNNITVLYRTNPNSKTAKWKCICGCGREYIKSTASIKKYRGYCQKCKFGFVGWTKIIKEAFNRNIPVELTSSEAISILRKQNYICNLTGTILTNKTASLDRIDNTLGYSINNCQWVHYLVNFSKRCLSQNQFISLCYDVVQNSKFDLADWKNKDNSLKNIILKKGDNNCLSDKRQYYGTKLSNDSYKYLGVVRYYWSKIKQGASKRKIKLEISHEEANDLLYKQKFRCALSGKNITLPTSRYNRAEYSASLDRIDSTECYKLSNCQWVHKYINLSKLQLNNNEFYSMCLDVVTHNDIIYEEWSHK